MEETIKQFQQESHRRLMEIARYEIEQNSKLALANAQLCHSPIEKLFFLAWNEIVERERLHFIRHRELHVNPTRFDNGRRLSLDDAIRYFHDDVQNMKITQIDLVFPQYGIGDYRVDFVLIRIEGNWIDWRSESFKVFVLPKVIVECDGHDFHEKDREQAKKDKARDRFLQAEGFRVFRFTGSEIVQDPIKCAQEVNRFFFREAARHPNMSDRRVSRT